MDNVNKELNFNIMHAMKSFTDEQIKELLCRAYNMKPEDIAKINRLEDGTPDSFTPVQTIESINLTITLDKDSVTIS